MISYNDQLVLNSCQMQEVRIIEGIEGNMCFIYQVHPVAHAALKMDYVDNTLTTNVIRSCHVDIKLRQTKAKYLLQMNMTLMSGVYKLQNKMQQIEPKKVTV